MAPKFESLLIKMVAVEALQDPFLHMYTSANDQDHFKTMDVSGVTKIMMRQFKKDFKSYVGSQLALAEENNFKTNSDVGQVVRKNPGFDPVFMKV